MTHVYVDAIIDILLKLYVSAILFIFMFMHIIVECNNRIVLTRQITGVIMDYFRKD